MKQQLIELLGTLGYPVFLQGSLNPDEAYPDSFFTFWNFQTPEDLFYSNYPSAAVWGFWVYFYSVDPEKVERVTEQARQIIRSAGWTPDGRANDVSVDRPTHTGAMFTVYKFDNYSKEE